MIATLLAALVLHGAEPLPPVRYYNMECVVEFDAQLTPDGGAVIVALIGRKYACRSLGRREPRRSGLAPSAR